MMNLKGLDQLRKHVPDLNTPFGILSFFLLPILSFILVTEIFATVIPTWPIGSLGGEIVFLILGFLLIYQFFRYKENYRARFGLLAYSKAVQIGLPGAATIAAVVARIRSLPGPDFPHFGWDIVLPVLGWALIAVGALLFLRTLQIFGVDNLTMLYVYFPEESRLVNHKIYNILRHPAYSAAQWIAYGLVLLNGNWLALACALIFTVALWGWVGQVEEKELVERFGPAYAEYRQHVPAFWPHLRDLRGFFKFVIAGR